MAKSEVKVKFSVFNQDYKKGMEEINQANTKMKNEMKLSETQMKHSSSESEKLGHRIKRLGNEKENVAKKIELTEKQLQKAKDVYGENSEEAAKLADDLVKLQTSEQRLENAIIDANNEIEAQQAAMSDTSSSDKYKKSLEEVGEATKEIGQKVQDAGQALNDFGNWYSTRVTAPIVAGGAAIFKASMDFESAFANFRKVTDATEEEFATFNQAFRDLAKVIPVSTEEIANTAAAASQLGIEKEHVLAFTESMLAMGVASDMTSEQAAFTFARLANITGMAQEDFDRLGSTVVELGNNFAATESEIGEMALRIAGAGTQINMSEADIIGFAAALASVGIKAEAGGTAISKLMIEMASDVEQGGERLNEFARVAGMSTSEFKRAFEEDAATAIFTFLGGLGDLSEQGESAFGIIDELGLSEIRLRDTILRSSSAREMANEALKTANNAWSENTALQDEAAERYATTESQLRMMWNRIKDVAITLGDALIPAVMDAINAMEPLYQKIEELANGFSDLDEEQQRNILGWIAVIAAVGPVAKILGGTFTVIGGGIKLVGSLTTAIGTAKGGGLVARLALLAPAAGPVGLAIAGITGIGAAIYLLTRDTDEAVETNLELVKSLNEAHTELSEAANAYEELRAKANLTTEEFRELLELRYEMAQNPDEAALALLQERYAELAEKSGLTKDELENMFSANQAIIDQAPDVAEAHTKHGEAVAGVGEELKKVVQANLEIAQAEAELQRSNWAQERTQHIKDQVAAEKEREDINIRLAFLRENALVDEMTLAEMLSDAHDTSVNYLLTEQERNEARREADVLEQILSGRAREYQNILNEQLIEQNKIILAAEEHIQLGKELDAEYMNILLKNLDINDTGQAGVDIANEQLTKLREQRDALQEKFNKEGDQTGELQNQLGVLGEQIGAYERTLNLIDDEIGGVKTVTSEEKNRQDVLRRITSEFTTQGGALDVLKRKQEGNNRTIKDGEKNAKDMNTELKKDVTKNVDVKDNGTAKKIHDEATKSATKWVTLNASWKGVGAGLKSGIASAGVSAYATGTNYHPGGPAILGDGNGPELVREGAKWSIADLGLYNLKRGAQVFTHEQTMQLIQGIKNLPAYAGGVGVDSALSSQLNQMSFNVSATGPQPVQVHVDIESSDVLMEGRKVGAIVWRPVKEHIDRSNGRARKMPKGR